MKPVIPTAKRPSSFSIESLIRTETDKCSLPNFQADDIFRRHLLRNTDTGSRVPPTHPELLASFSRHCHDQATNAHALALRSWGLYSPSLDAGTSLWPGQYPLIGPVSVNPLLVNRTLQSQQLHPWLMTRQNHCFNYAIPGYTDSGLLFHPYRKPKRIRTAFSPHQLLKLDRAFDKNHYVVGQERKDLASKLGLTETQVKVWFQNRRTKYKRVKTEDESSVPHRHCGQSEICERENDETVDSDNPDEDNHIDVS
ncbi:homeotic protein empty spiracles-like [Gigantopelta aegis]|uniref:homeotic protein empty spiracles-like n=1 Tax=Gigantopelta aegis TaxID=1735272 RepID=UPI001B88B77C|nr:homeotic protein empty spiracles-like [Gigantopelta aegis]